MDKCALVQPITQLIECCPVNGGLFNELKGGDEKKFQFLRRLLQDVATLLLTASAFTMFTEFRIVLCSCPNQATAKALADKLLRARLVGCVNITAQSTSMYWWEDHIHSEEEVMLMMKTTTAHVDALFAAIQKAHPYEVPEIIAIPIAEGSSDYLRWLTKVTH